MHAHFCLHQIISNLTIHIIRFGVLISKVFVISREGEIHAKICHFHGFFYFRWYSMTIIYSRQIFLVLPQDKLFSITFETHASQPVGGRRHLNPLIMVFLPTLMTNLGRQGYWWAALEEEIAGEGAAFPRGSSKLKTVKIFVLFNFINSF